MYALCFQARAFSVRPASRVCARRWARIDHEYGARVPPQATPDGLAFLRGMGWGRLIESPLNPLRVCLESVAIEVRARVPCRAPRQRPPRAINAPPRSSCESRARLTSPPRPRSNAQRQH